MAVSNPPVVPPDTSPDVWRLQMKAIGRRSVADRLKEWEALNRWADQAEEAGVRRRHPGYGDRQVMLAQARMRYGDELVLKVWPDEDLVEP
ncbi:hypothetical protein [Candidatus Neomicrothrix sp.]|uniref:hypothetical protein n=1 Tax=Candidatus Neomicrothrix sp. TaxID=2719034 RepID=UPI001B3F48BE|nr:hypothetical protein [Candidatus Microthrix sp.]MBP7877464.1 hypothetical protein [Candidatus Microthrix sp.]